jgi:hypothetical protein
MAVNAYGFMDKLVNKSIAAMNRIFGVDLSRNTHPFCYGLNTPVDLTNVLGNTGRGTIRITQEAFFVATHLGMTVRDNAAAVGNPGDLLPQMPRATGGADPTAGILIRIQDDGNDVIWDNVGVDNALISTELAPWVELAKPYAIERNSNITFDLTNLTADPKRFRGYLWGWKVKDLRSLNLTMPRS